jgi:hypothetical protein
MRSEAPPFFSGKFMDRRNVLDGGFTIFFKAGRMPLNANRTG